MVARVQPNQTFYDLTLNDISRRLNLSLMTLYNWRVGSGRTKPLPVKEYMLGKSRRILVDERKLIKWLTEFRPDLAQEWTRHERKRKAA